MARKKKQAQPVESKPVCTQSFPVEKQQVSNGLPYYEKLKDPRWQKRRLEILERDGWQCQACSAKDKTLHVHHKEYRRNVEPWDYKDRDLVALCEECHEHNKSISFVLQSFTTRTSPDICYFVASVLRAVSDGFEFMGAAPAGKLQVFELANRIAVARFSWDAACQLAEDYDRAQDWDRVKRGVIEDWFGVVK